MRSAIAASCVALWATSIPTASAAAPSSSYEIVDVEPGAAEPHAAGSEHTLIYLNRHGGAFTPGSNDAIANSTSLVEDTTVMPSFDGSDQEWDELLACVEEQFAGFRVVVSDEDPGSHPHYEAVVSGEPADLGRPDHIGGLSPFRLDCGVIDNSIVFVFAELYDGNTARLCEVVAQEIAHSFGLDHQMNCDDPMSYVGGCGEKRFRNFDAACGEYEERECACGQPSQNSKKLLARHLGDTEPPEIEVMMPADASTVPASFCAVAQVGDNVDVEKVELFVDGKRVTSRGNAPYAFEIAALSAGLHRLELVAHDTENTSSVSHELLVDPQLEPTGCTEVQLLGQSLSGSPSNITAGCNASSSQNRAWSLWLLGAVVAMRRRRLFCARPRRSRR